MLAPLCALAALSLANAQYSTEATKGFLGFIDHNPIKYYIPADRCNAYLDLDYVGCEYNGTQYPPAKLWVSVEDTHPFAKVTISEARDNVYIWRVGPCSGVSHVTVQQSCALYQIASRRSAGDATLAAALPLGINVHGLQALPNVVSHSV